MRSTSDWFFKYKLYHIPFWFVYHYLWAVVKVGDPLEVAGAIFSSTPSIKFIFYVVFQAIAVYFNLYYLIPKFLEKSRFSEYIICLVLTIICTASLIVPGYFLDALLANNTVLAIYGTEKFLHFFMTFSLASTMASMTLAMSIKLTKNWIQARRKQQLLEREKLETELKFLKSQFNPHFLFNTINSIFVLIRKNPTMASDALSKFSELLRYQLYECNEHEIPLEQELTYLNNFIELEKLRHDHDSLQLSVQLEKPRDPDLTIAPFVLIPFVENAFKHVTKQKDESNWISMDLLFDRHQLQFVVSNSIDIQERKSREFVEYSGLGLNNVQRRLDLIYPGEHELSVEKNHDQFIVNLKLNLHRYRVNKPVFEQMEM